MIIKWRVLVLGKSIQEIILEKKYPLKKEQNEMAPT
jgi:hypothetical protein